MKNSLLANLCCPACGQSLVVEDAQPDARSDAQILEGNLKCASCATVYPIRKGIPNLLSQGLLEEYKRNEMQGWVNLWKKKGMYDRPTLEHSFALPYLDGIWADVSRMFDLAMQDMNLQGNEFILDMGAGQGWASRYFAAKGCRVVAVDIVDDEWYGLGRAWAIMEKAGVYFEPLLADGENLPFRPETFDIVFFCGALHHFRDFGKILKQVNKVLKPGGRVVAAGEPSIALIVHERDVQNSLEEMQEGIVERRAKVSEYWWSLRRAGFHDICINIAETYNAAPIQIYSWILSARQNLFRTVRRRYKALVWSALSVLLMFPSRWARRLALLANGGNLLIRARKD
jgi:SAM-dependent methyltransferase